MHYFVSFSVLITKHTISIVNEIKELKDATDRLDIIPESYDSINKHGNPSKLINNAFNRDILFLKYLDKPRLINLAEAVHGDTCHIIQMHLWKRGCQIYFFSIFEYNMIFNTVFILILI